MLERVAGIGFVGVEFAGFYGVSAAEVGRVLQANGLEAARARTSVSPPTTTFKAALDEHVAVGCDTVVIPSAPHTGFSDPDQVRATADLVNHAAALAHDRGVHTLGYHNHFWELTPIPDGRPALLHFYEHTDPDVLAEVDIYWAQVGGADPAAVVAELGERAALLHVKDGPGRRGSANVAVGDGAVDTPGVLAAATSAGAGTSWSSTVATPTCSPRSSAASTISCRRACSRGQRVNRVGIVGCGVISRTYGYALGMFDWIDLITCADALPERAEERAEQWGTRALPVDDLLSHPDIDVVVNLTPPKMHAAVDHHARVEEVGVQREAARHRPRRGRRAPSRRPSPPTCTSSRPTRSSAWACRCAAR